MPIEILDADQTGAPVVPVPGSDLRTAVVFVDGPGFAQCGEVPDHTVPETMWPMRVDALDAAGEVLGCLGGP